MNLAQQRLVTGWLLAAVGLASLAGAQRYPWLYAPFALVLIFGFIVSGLAGERRPTYEERHLASLELEAMINRYPWLKLWCISIGVVALVVIIVVLFRLADFRLPNDPWVIGALLAVVLLPVFVMRQYERYQYLGAQSNQPLHPTPAGGQTAADGAGERRR